MRLRPGVDFELGQDVAERLLFAEAASVSGWVWILVPGRKGKCQ